MSFEVLGVLFAALIQGVMIGVYNKKVSCEEMLISNSTNKFYNYSTTNKPNYTTNLETNSSSLSSFIPNYSKFVRISEIFLNFIKNINLK